MATPDVDGTKEQLRQLTAGGKRLKALRDKRDQLRGELKVTEKEIAGAHALVTKITAKLADEKPQTNGEEPQ